MRQTWKLNLIAIFLYVFILSSVTVSSQDFGENLSISLITCDPGDGIDMLFGHSAVRVNDGVNDLVYNYGTFDFDTPGFVIKFMRGKLPYSLAVNDFGYFLRVYQHEERTVREQKLNLTSEQKKQYLEFLQENALPENALYQYDFFWDNCSTRIRDGLESEVGNLNFPRYQTEISYRDILHKYLVGYPWTKHGIDLIIGSLADDTADVKQQMFIPDFLHDHLSNTNVGDQTFAPKSKPLINFANEANLRKQHGLFTPTLIYGGILICWLVLLFTGKNDLVMKLSNLIYVIIFLAGSLICFLWFGTDHMPTKANFNILWLNPLVLLTFTSNAKLAKLLKLLMLGLTVVCLIGMVTRLINQVHPSIMLGVFVAFVYLIDIFYLNNIDNKV